MAEVQKFQSTDGTTLAFADQGEGVPILCLAGLTRNMADFQHVLPHLRGRVICLDYRGRGQSDWADPATYTIPQEAQDALALLDHLELDTTAILGTSRGGLIAMVLAATAPERLLGVALNDIGPEIAPKGLEVIKDYIGHRPAQATYEEAAAFRARNWVHFRNVPMARWRAEVEAHYRKEADGLHLRYDPRLRDAVLAAGAQPAPDLWPLFDALKRLPTALIHGANSDLLTDETAEKMQQRHPDMIYARVADRGHVPFLDEPEALDALRRWQDALHAI